MRFGNRSNSFFEGESSRKAKRKERETRCDDDDEARNGSKRRAGRPSNNETQEEKNEKKITNDQRARSKHTAKLKRFENWIGRFLIWVEKLIEFFQLLFQFHIINPEEKKGELERLDKTEEKLQNKEKVQIDKCKQLLKSLQIDKKELVDKISSNPECIKKLEDEKLKLQREIRKVKDKIGLLHNQDKNLMGSIVKHHLTNANHDLKELGELLLKHNHNVDKCNRLQDENAELEAEIKELKLEIKWLRDFSDKPKAEGKTHQNYKTKAEFERKLEHEKWRLENVKDDLDAEITRLRTQNKLLEWFLYFQNKMTCFGILAHNFDPITTDLSPLPPPGSMKDLAIIHQGLSEEIQPNCDVQAAVVDEEPQFNNPGIDQNMIPPPNCPATNNTHTDEDDKCIACKCTEGVINQHTTDKNTVKTSDFKIPEEELKVTDKESIPQVLDYVHKGIGRNVTIGCRLAIGMCVAVARALLYAVIDEMHNLRMENLNEETLNKWWFVIRDAKEMNFDVDFIQEHFKKIAHAYFSKIENGKLKALELQISTTREELVNYFAMKLDELGEMDKRKEKLQRQHDGARHSFYEPDEEAKSFDGVALSTGILY